MFIDVSNNVSQFGSSELPQTPDASAGTPTGNTRDTYPYMSSKLTSLSHKLTLSYRSIQASPAWTACSSVMMLQIEIPSDMLKGCSVSVPGCYIAQMIERPLIGTYRAMRLSTVVLASKSDLEKEVDPQRAIEIIQQYDVGLVEVTNSSQSGREKMQRSFQWILKSIRVARRQFIKLDALRNSLCV